MDWLCLPRFDSPPYSPPFWMPKRAAASRFGQRHILPLNGVTGATPISWKPPLGRKLACLGASIGLIHGLFVLATFVPLLPYLHPRMANEHDGPTSIRMLEPPGFMAFNYGRRTLLIILIAHMAYGGIMGAFYEIV